MAKHVYLSTRSAVLAKSCLKMDADARRERKKIQRRNLVDARRKDTVIAEYIKTKYNHLYKEALKFHDTIKEKYPEKFDLRKTNEFKVLKTDATRETEKPSSPKMTSPPVVKRVILPSLTHGDTMRLKIPLLPNKSITSLTTEEDISLQAVTDQIQSPLHHEGDSELIREIPDGLRDNTTEVDMALQTITAEYVLEEDMIHPSLYDDLDREQITKIIDELRDEPFLKDIFNDIEAQFETELDMDIDFEPDSRLENELNLLL